MNEVQFNPLKTREDVERAAVQLIKPLLPLLSPGFARLDLGNTGAVYPAAIAQMEGFARPLWAIVPMLMGNCEGVKPLFAAWRQGIIHGVDKNHPEYWGQVQDYDQRLVEMAVFGMGLCLAPREMYFDLPGDAQDNLYEWLNQINVHDMPKNNWTFFRVLVNLGFMTVGRPYPQERMELDLRMIEEHYEGDGWYFDYENQREYYTMWAFHYYGLVYAYVMKDKDARRSALFIERGRKMAKDFALWFDKSGEALPYGRSLTYRFAQGAFYAALALADGEAPEFSYGEMKHLLLGNMRKWFSLPIFTRDGVLSIGYHYDNLIMAEGYNAPGSPYWAMKAFLCLALPREHAFWQAEEVAPITPQSALQPHARMLLVKSADGSHVMGFEAGNHAGEHAHDEAKYEKFVYSTVFGFSVPKSQKLLKCGAYDNVLAVSDDGVSFRPRYGCQSYTLSDTCVKFTWQPYPDCTIETEIYPVGEWHVRVHHITSQRDMLVAEGGYALARDGAGEAEVKQGAGFASASAPWGASAVYALEGFEEGVVCLPEPNTNLMSPRTLLPTLLGHIKAGKTTLVSAVVGSKTRGTACRAQMPKELEQYAKLG